MAKKNQKHGDKPLKKEDKKVVTIKVPSLGLKHFVIILGVLLIVSLFFNFKGGFTKTATQGTSLSGLVYMCPPTNCDTTQTNEWSGQLGFGVTPYEASWAQVPIGLLFEGKSVEIVDVSTESGFYKSICDSTQNQKACDMSGEAGKNQAEEACKAMTKNDKPQLEAFVVSYCPYGLQMQRILVPVHELLGSVADIKVRYIGSISDGKITSMYGDEEAQENLKQICIREEQPDKYWVYLNCFMKAQGKSDACSKEVGIDAKKLESCMTDPNKGLKYAQADFDAGNKYGVTGSPTMILNGKAASEFDFGGRTAEAVKTLVCCGMSSEASQCSTALSTDQANTAFAETYSSGQGSTGSGAQC